MRSLALTLLVAPALLGASPAHALSLCARIDKATGEPREGASIKLRSQCRPGEAAIGSTEEFAALRADIDETRAEVDSNSAAIDSALGLAEAARVPAARPATIAKATSGCGLMVTNGDAYFEGCNVHVRNRTGTTAGTVDGRGNLIVGYDEGWDEKTGSHNLIVGPYNHYPTYGGFVAGFGNKVSGLYSSVLGGVDNTASGAYSSVSGGERNWASGPFSSVLGGGRGIAPGVSNEAKGAWSSVLGGLENTANETFSTIPPIP